MTTHEDLEVSTSLAGYFTDTANDTLYYRISSATGGTAKISGDGQSVIFTPTVGYTGPASFVIVADDGFVQSQPLTVYINVSAAPLLAIHLSAITNLSQGQAMTPAITLDFSDETGVQLTDPSSYVSLDFQNLAEMGSLGSSPTSYNENTRQIIAAGIGPALISVSHTDDNGSTIQAVQAFNVGPADQTSNSDISFNTTPTVLPASLALTPGMAYQLTASLIDDEGNSTDIALTSQPLSGTEYISSNPSVATVSTEGLVTALAPGQATISVIHLGTTYDDNNNYDYQQIGQTDLSIVISLPQMVDGGTNPAIHITPSAGGVVADAAGDTVLIGPNALLSDANIGITKISVPNLQSVTGLAAPLSAIGAAQAVAAFNLNLDAQGLANPAQLLIPLQTSGAALGDQVFFFRQDSILGGDGNVHQTWWLTDSGIVVNDATGQLFAETNGSQYGGVLQGGNYVVVFANNAAQIQVSIPAATTVSFGDLGYAWASPEEVDSAAGTVNLLLPVDASESSSLDVIRYDYGTPLVAKTSISSLVEPTSQPQFAPNSASMARAQIAPSAIGKVNLNGLLPAVVSPQGQSIALPNITSAQFAPSTNSTVSLGTYTMSLSAPVSSSVLAGFNAQVVPRLIAPSGQVIELAPIAGAFGVQSLSFDIPFIAASNGAVSIGSAKSGYLPAGTALGSLSVQLALKITRSGVSPGGGVAAIIAGSSIYFTGNVITPTVAQGLSASLVTSTSGTTVNFYNNTQQDGTSGSLEISETQQLTTSFAQGPVTNPIAFSADQSTAYVAVNSTIYEIDTTTFRLIGIVRLPPNTPGVITSVKDVGGTLYVSTGAAWGSGSEYGIWMLSVDPAQLSKFNKTWVAIQLPKGLSPFGISGMDISPDGRYLVASAGDILVLDLSSVDANGIVAKGGCAVVVPPKVGGASQYVTATSSSTLFLISNLGGAGATGVGGVTDNGVSALNIGINTQAGATFGSLADLPKVVASASSLSGAASNVWSLTPVSLVQPDKSVVVDRLDIGTAAGLVVTPDLQYAFVADRNDPDDDAFYEHMIQSGFGDGVQFLSPDGPPTPVDPNPKQVNVGGKIGVIYNPFGLTQFTSFGSVGNAIYLGATGPDIGEQYGSIALVGNQLIVQADGISAYSAFNSNIEYDSPTVGSSETFTFNVQSLETAAAASSNVDLSNALNVYPIPLVGAATGFDRGATAAPVLTQLYVEGNPGDVNEVDLKSLITTQTPGLKTSQLRNFSISQSTIANILANPSSAVTSTSAAAAYGYLYQGKYDNLASEGHILLATQTPYNPLSSSLIQLLSATPDNAHGNAVINDQGATFSDTGVLFAYRNITSWEEAYILQYGKMLSAQTLSLNISYQQQDANSGQWVTKTARLTISIADSPTATSVYFGDRPQNDYGYTDIVTRTNDIGADSLEKFEFVQRLEYLAFPAMGFGHLNGQKSSNVFNLQGNAYSIGNAAYFNVEQNLTDQNVPTGGNAASPYFSNDGQWTLEDQYALYFFYAEINYAPGIQRYLAHQINNPGVNQTTPTNLLADVQQLNTAGVNYTHDGYTHKLLDYLNAYNAPHWMNIGAEMTQASTAYFVNPEQAPSLSQWYNKQTFAARGKVEIYGASWMRDLMAAASYAPTQLETLDEQSGYSDKFLFNGSVDANEGFTPKAVGGHKTHDLGLAFDLGIDQSFIDPKNEQSKVSYDNTPSLPPASTNPWSVASAESDSTQAFLSSLGGGVNSTTPLPTDPPYFVGGKADDQEDPLRQFLQIYSVTQSTTFSDPGQTAAQSQQQWASALHVENSLTGTTSIMQALFGPGGPESSNSLITQVHIGDPSYNSYPDINKALHMLGIASTAVQPHDDHFHLYLGVPHAIHVTGTTAIETAVPNNAASAQSAIYRSDSENNSSIAAQTNAAVSARPAKGALPESSGPLGSNPVGDFNAALTIGGSWNGTGSVLISNGSASFSESSSEMTGLSQTFTLESGTEGLDFTIDRAHFSNNGAGIPPDAFEVALLNAITGQPVAGTVQLSNTDALFNLQSNGESFTASTTHIYGLSVPTNGSLDITSPVEVAVDLSGVAPGTPVELYFELLGFGAANSTISISDVQLLSTLTQPPVANNASIAAFENQPVTIDLHADAFDSQNLALTMSIVDGPKSGTLTQNTDGTYTYSPNPSFYGMDTFTYQASDGQSTSSVATVTINVAAVNQAPAGSSKTVATLENTPYVFSTTDFGYSDPDNNPPKAFAGVVVDTLPGVGSLTDSGHAVAEGQFISAQDITGGLLVFTPETYASGANYASFNFQVRNAGGTADGGDDTDPSPKTETINVTWVNQAPVGSSSTVSTLENAPYIFGVSNFGYSDPDNSPAESFAGVVVDTLPTVGSLMNNGQAVTAGQFISASDIANGQLTFTPVTYTSGANYASFGFQVRNSGGTANGGQDTAPNVKTLTVNVTWVNQAPMGASKTVTTLENSPYVFGTSDFGYSDPHNSPAESFLGLTVDTLPTVGALTNNGTAVTVGEFISASDIAAGLLVYTPSTYGNGANYASFQFQVENAGGTANGGHDSDPAPKTLTVNVTWVNQAPVGTDKTVATLENTPYVFATGDFGYSDPDNNPAEAFAGILIGALPSAGTLTDNGQAVAAGQFVSASDIAGGLLVFTPRTYDSGANYASFSFQVRNAGGTANGGQDTDPNPRTETINVRWVNQAPVGTSGSVTTLENQAYAFTAANFGFSDPHNNPAEAFAGLIVDNLPSLGALTDNGKAVTTGELISASDIANGLFLFTPALYSSGNNYASFHFQVENAGGTSNGGHDTDPNAKTLAINVTAVNQAPAGASATVSTNENTPYTFSAANFGYSDPHNSPAEPFAGLIVDTLPSAGTLTDNGHAVIAGQFVSASDVANGLLVFTPASNGSGSPYANFTFQVENNGGTANGGQNTDPVSKTITINVIQVSSTLSVNLGVAANFNAFVFQNFTSSGSDTQGSLAVGGNLSVSSYSVNANHESYNGLSAIVGGSISFTGGQLNGQATYVISANVSNLGSSDSVRQANPPFSFSSVQSQLSTLSGNLAGLKANGTVTSAYGGLTFTGDGTSNPQVFDISASLLQSANYANFSNLSSGQTVIVNVNGTSAGFQGGTPNGFSNYNTLFNFYNATTLTFSNVGIYGSILAPLATVSGGGGQINGNVVVNAWNSGIQINASHFFNPTTINTGSGQQPQLAMARTYVAEPASQRTAIPAQSAMAAPYSGIPTTPAQAGMGFKAAAAVTGQAAATVSPFIEKPARGQTINFRSLGSASKPTMDVDHRLPGRAVKQVVAGGGAGLQIDWNSEALSEVEEGRELDSGAVAWLAGFLGADEQQRDLAGLTGLTVMLGSGHNASGAGASGTGGRPN